MRQTSWKTTFNNSDVIVEFETDSLNLIIGNEQLDISTYSIDNDTLILVDHPGSTCSDTVVGTYLFSIINDTMFVELVTDSCVNRRLFFTDAELVKCITSSIYKSEISKPIVFPNPNISNRFFIKNVARITYDYIIYNSVGKTLQVGQTLDFIDVESIETMLFLQLSNNGYKYTYKLILM